MMLLGSVYSYLLSMKKLLPILILSLFILQCSDQTDCSDPDLCSDCTGCEYEDEFGDEEGDEEGGEEGGEEYWWSNCCPNYCSGNYYYYNRSCSNGYCTGATSDYCSDGCNANGCIETYGCTNTSACNFDADATADDGSCWSATEGCECSDGEGSVADECGICGGSNDICYDMKFVNEIAANQVISIYQNSTQNDNLIYSQYCPDYCIVVEEDLLPEDNNYIVQFGGGIPVYFDVSTDVLITNTSDGLIITEWNP